MLATRTISRTPPDRPERSAIRPTICEILPAPTSARRQVEAFIHDTFARAYDADIRVDYPVLLAVRAGDGRILAAAGYRLAATGPLFLEQYTGESIERVLARHHTHTPARERIAEVGSLASAGGGATLTLFAFLTACLTAQGVTDLTVTVTSDLQRRFERAGLRSSWLCAATPDRLTAGRDRWGSYYDTDPRVLALSLQDIVAALEQSPIPGLARYSA